MKRATRAQSKRNVVPEIPTTLPSDLPAPSTSRNPIPRSRATSIARSASRSLPGSRDSSRRSSLSRLGDSTSLSESSFSETRPPNPGGTISGPGTSAGPAYSREDTLLSGADAQVEVAANGTQSQSQEPASSTTSQEPATNSTSQASSPRNMFPYFSGDYSGPGQRGGVFRNALPESTNGWPPSSMNAGADDVSQQQDSFAFDEDFGMRQYSASNDVSRLGYSGWASEIPGQSDTTSHSRQISLVPQSQEPFSTSTARQPSSVNRRPYDYYSESRERFGQRQNAPLGDIDAWPSSPMNVYAGNVPQQQSASPSYAQSYNSTPPRVSTRPGTYNTYIEPSAGRAQTFPGPSYPYNPSPHRQHRVGLPNGFYDPVPPSPSEERELYMPNNAMNQPWSSSSPSRTVHLAHTFDPYNPQQYMHLMASNDQHSLPANAGSAAAAPPLESPTTFLQGSSNRSADAAEYATSFSSLSQWQQPSENSSGPLQQGASSASISTGVKRKRSPESETLQHSQSSFRPIDASAPSSQGSGRVDSDNEVAEQLLYFHPGGFPQSDDGIARENPPIDRKGKGKARAQTPVNENSIIDITDSPLLERHKADTDNAVDGAQPGGKQKPAAEPLSSYTCPICFSPPTNATITPCGHICCGACLFAAVKTTLQRATYGMARPPLSEARCPVCRAIIPGWDGKGGGVIGLKVRAIFSL